MRNGKPTMVTCSAELPPADTLSRSEPMAWSGYVFARLRARPVAARISRSTARW
jgi:hypothetical protein